MKILEIGAGACTNVAFYHSLYEGTKIHVIDLPEIIIQGFCFLKCIFPNIKILFPHEVHSKTQLDDYDVVFMTPNQSKFLPEENYDYVYNKSSFGEMDIDTVNNYLELSGKLLKKGGSIHSINQKISRHIEKNKFSNYKFANNFAPSKLFELKFTNSSKMLKKLGLEYIFSVTTKEKL